MAQMNVAASLRPFLGAAFPPVELPEQEMALLADLQRILDTDVEPGATEVDRVGRYPTAAVASLKRSGVLASAVPKRFGGLGASNRFSAEAQVRMAAADSAVAQVFKVHDELAREMFQYCPVEFGPHLARLLLHENVVIGLAVAENRSRVDAPMQTTAVEQPDGSFVVNGTKIYTTGAAEADYIALWAFDTAAGAEDFRLGLRLNLIPPTAPGVTVHRDWDALGQRGTDSGTVTFDDVRTDP
ncbi:MAG TPA: acyl-CoA dehydrogenase family protein, partial [Acidimicrobiales bacterium]|nr:acyl-CoA dehydrogenase family protein [Acidimicrobiales bacterium]